MISTILLLWILVSIICAACLLLCCRSEKFANLARAASELADEYNEQYIYDNEDNPKEK